MKTITLRLTKIILWSLALALVLHAAVSLYAGIRLRNVDQSLAEAGRPINPDEVIPPDVPPLLNAAPLYASAFSLLKSDASGEENIFNALNEAARAFAENPDQPARADAFGALLQRDTVQQALDLIAQGAGRPRSRFDLDYAQGHALLHPHIINLLNAGRILAAKARWEAQNGQGPEAWQTIETGLQLADAVRDEPLLISQLVRIAIVRETLSGIAAVSAITPPDAETAARLHHRLDRAADPALLVLAIDGERILGGESIISSIIDSSPAEREELLGIRSSLLPMLSLHYPPTRKLDIALYNAEMARQAQALINGSGPPITSNDSFPFYAILTKTITPSFSGMHERQQALIDELAATRQALPHPGASHRADE